MRFLRFHKKPVQSPHKSMILKEPESLIGHCIGSRNIKLVSVLGVGGHGVVYYALETPPSHSAGGSPRAYAVKVLSKVGLDQQQLQFLKNEFALHKRVSGHKHIVAFHGVIEEPDFFFVLLDYVEEGDVFDTIEMRGIYAGNDELIKKVFVQLLDAVAHCHSLGVAHRDIKPENILCRDGGTHFLLTDFGLATDKTVVCEYGSGSEPYMAPQCFGGFWKKLGPYSAAEMDVWSLGVVLVNLVCGCNPWHRATNDSPIFCAFLSDPDHLSRILPISPELNTILRGTFSLNPHARISVAVLRKSVLEVQHFTRDVPRIAVPRPVESSADAPDTIVARQMSNEEAGPLDGGLLTEVPQQSETEVKAIVTAAESDKEDKDGSVLRHPASFSPTPTLNTEDMPPRAPEEPISTPKRSDVLRVSSTDSDSESDDSEGPTTPETNAALDVDIAGVPEISLDSDGTFHHTSDDHVSAGTEKAQTRREAIPLLMSLLDL